jgi:uncharacterized protein YjbI with pentapeptide repeats
VVRKKPGRKAEPPSKRGIAWPRWTGFRGKTIWDWLQLLIVPFVLALVGFLFAWQQDARQQQVEEQRAQDLALQAYLDQMSTLVLEDLGDPKVRTVARARTLTVLSRLDPSRKAEVMQFLLEADLVHQGAPVIELDDADLSGVDLSGATLSDANLSGANLSGASLSLADLNGAQLNNTNLSDALVSFAVLRDADLQDADLQDASLAGSELVGANLGGADLIDADLRGAVLSIAVLHDADLSGANLSGADLYDVDLSDADLSDADLSEAKYITPEELEQQAATLEGATMPNGQKYEDWLKSKGRGEDEQNSGAE